MVGPGHNVKLKLEGKESPHGIFLHPPARSSSEVTYRIDGKKFLGAAVVFRPSDIARQALPSPVTFEVSGDGRMLWRSETLTEYERIQNFEIDVRNIKLLELRVYCSGSNYACWAAWLEPRIAK